MRSQFRFCQPSNLAISCLWGWESEMGKWVQWCRGKGGPRSTQWLLPHWPPEAPPSHWPLSLITRWLSGQPIFYKALRTVTAVGRCSGNVDSCPSGLLLLLLSHFSRVWLCVTHRGQPTRLPRPWVLVSWRCCFPTRDVSFLWQQLN